MFITFEGIEGSGKSTQAELLYNFLAQQGHKVSLTREPGWGKLGSLIRQAVLEERDLDLCAVSELYLFCADRAQHVSEYIKPKLNNNEIVICDRFYDSTVVYQGYGRKLDLEFVNKVAKESALGLKPDMTFLLNLPVREGLSRLPERGGTSKMDEEPLEFHELIRQGYMLVSKRDSERFIKINADREINEIHKEIRDVTMRRITAAGD